MIYGNLKKKKKNSPSTADSPADSRQRRRLRASFSRALGSAPLATAWRWWGDTPSHHPFFLGFSIPCGTKIPSPVGLPILLATDRVPRSPRSCWLNLMSPQVSLIWQSSFPPLFFIKPDQATIFSSCVHWNPKTHVVVNLITTSHRTIMFSSFLRYSKPFAEASPGFPKIKKTPPRWLSLRYRVPSATAGWLLHSRCIISGWWLGHPSEKYERQLGWWHSQYFWEYKIDVPNHQPYIYI